METQYECIPCFVRQASEAITLSFDDSAAREKMLRKMLRTLASSPWDGSPPGIAQRMHRALRKAGGSDDPFMQIKKDMNSMAAEILPKVREKLKSSSSPFEDAVKFAIAGNILDSGAKTQIAPADLPAHLEKILGQPLHGDAMQLLRAAEKASSILYLADNAGEIFFDRLLLEMLPAGKITLAVRGRPIINDATMEDARLAGIHKLARIVGNGSDAPGTILGDTSSEFGKIFHASDMIIAKGQGNYETLSECGKDIFFLLTVKCPTVARHIGAPLGGMVLKLAGKKG